VRLSCRSFIPRQHADPLQLRSVDKAGQTLPTPQDFTGRCPKSSDSRIELVVTSIRQVTRGGPDAAPGI
jgi:hypothetical protein